MAAQPSDHRPAVTHHPAVDYQQLQLPYRPHDGQHTRHPVVIVGAGPVGLTLALDLAAQGQPVLVLDDDDRLSTGSRAICFAQRALDIWDRLGVASRMADKGVSWQVGRLFFRDEEVWHFDLQPDPGHRRPAFINLQQYYCEGYLHDAAAAHPGIELRWRHRVTAVQDTGGQVAVTVDTPDGAYTLSADWLVACDGARSPVRQHLGLSTEGRIFRDRFLIVDVRVEKDIPAERWFWFDPPFNPGQSALLHRQPDGVWRLDFQLGWDADPEAERREENVLPRVRALLGDDTPFTIEWVSVYTFACERMASFRQGRVFFAGDAAHRVSPFGARGANSGVQDADNLAWKLTRVLDGRAPAALLDTYGLEREPAADENLQHSSRATDFITPKSEISRLFRDTVLRLARHHGFARQLVNSGRLSTASHYTGSPLNTPDGDAFAAALPLGAPAPDAPVRHDGQAAWWLSQLGGEFVAAQYLDRLPPDGLPRLDGAGALRTCLVLAPALAEAAPPPGQATVIDQEGWFARRYDARDGSTYLFRPDQHLAARWRQWRPEALLAALRRASGHDLPPTETP